MTLLYGEASIFQKPQKMQEDLHSQEFALIISVKMCLGYNNIKKKKSHKNIPKIHLTGLARLEANIFKTGVKIITPFS